MRNPVSLSIDEQGRVFVVESGSAAQFRHRHPLAHREWLDSDLSFRTVQDRNFLKREVVPANKAVLDRLTKPGQGGFSDFNRDGVTRLALTSKCKSERIRLPKTPTAMAAPTLCACSPTVSRTHHRRSARQECWRAHGRV